MDGACFCISSRPLSLSAGGLEDGTERRDQRGGRRRVEDVQYLVAAGGEVDAAIQPVGVLVLEHGVAVVPEPREPVEVALVPGRLAGGLRVALPVRASLSTVRVVGGH